MPRVTNCLHSFKEANPEVAAYLAKKAGVDFDGTNGKEQYLAAIKALQQNSLDAINDIYADLGMEGYSRVKLGEKQISEAADIAGQTLTPIQQRMTNADYIDQGELNQTADQLYDLMDKIDNSSLTEEQKKSSHNLIEPLINQLESYEFATTTKVSTITEEAPTGRTAKTKIETKPILEQSEGSIVQIKDEEGNTVRGTLNVRGNTYVVDVPGARQRVLGEKRMTDRTLALPEEDEMAHPVTLDQDGNVKSVTVKIHSGHLITIEDPEKALDIAIQLQAQQLGEVPDGAFNEIYEEVEKQVTETVLVKEGKLSPADIHKASKEAGIDFESDEFMDKSEELTGKRHLDDMSVEQLRKVYQYVKSQTKSAAAKTAQTKASSTTADTQKEAATHAEDIKQKFRKEFKNENTTDAQIDGSIALMDARANAWAREEKGRTPEQWFLKISDVKKGEFVTGDIKYQEVLASSNAIFETRDGTPIGYNYDTDQVARERFDFSKLKQIGKGSDRTVFDLGDGRVLKVAHTARGLEQNIHEGDYMLSGIVPEVYERGLNYVVAGNVPRIKAADKVTTYDIETGEETGTTTAGQMLRELQQFTQRDFDKHDEKLDVVLRKYGFEDIRNYDVLYADFIAARNWGYSNKGTPLHIDGGTFGGVQMIVSHKGKAPLTDPEFREIYNKSRQLKKQYQDTDKFTKFQSGGVKAGSKRGATETLADGRVVIHALESPDFSTMVHEIAHVFEKDLTADEKKLVKDFGGSEAFARGFERYLRDGKAPNEQMQSLFDKFKDWLTAIYKTIKGSKIDVEITPQVKEVFDRLLSGQPPQNAQLAANKKISELVPGLGGEKELENEIKAAAAAKAGLKPSDIHAAAKAAGIDFESKQFMDKSEELTGKRHLDDMNASELGKVNDYIKSQAKPKQDVVPSVQAQPTPAAQPQPAQPKPVVNKEKFKQAADTIRKGKLDKDITMAGVPFLKEVWNGAVEVTAQAVERTGDIAAAVEEGIRYVKNSDWYKGLTSDQKKRAEQRFRDEFEEEPQKPSGIRMSLVSDEMIRKADVERIGDLEMMDLGRKILATGEVKPEALVQQILEEKTGVLKPAEVVAMITYKADLDTLLRDAYRELNEKQAAGQYTGALRGEIRDMERKQAEFEVAAVITAATQSMAFRLRQYMLNQDYNVTKQIEKYKSNNNGYIPPHIEEKFRDLDRQLRDIKDKLAIAERQLYERQGQQAVNDIKEDIDRKEGAALYTQEQLEQKVREGVQKTIDEIYKKLPKEKKSIADKAIKALENFQKTLRGKSYSDATGFVAIIDSGITIIKNAIKAGVAVAEAVEIGIRGIRDAMQRAGLTQFKEDEFRKDALAAFNSAGVKTDRAKQDKPVINIDGTITVPDEMLRQLVAQGMKNIDQITDAVHDQIKGELPDVTKRQVRDFITDYAKRVNPTRDDLQLQVNAAKRVGRLLSELEDLQRGIRKQSNPSTRAKMTDDERQLKQKIRAVEKLLPKTPGEKSQESTDNVERAKERLRTKIAELQTRIANGDFAKKEKKLLPTDPEMQQLQTKKELLQQEFDNEQYKNELKQRTTLKWWEDFFLELTNGLVRALVASIDLSAAGVQGLWRLGSNPILSAQAFATSVQHLVSEKASEQFLAEIKQRPMYPLMQATKLALDDKSGQVSVKEGLFISNWVNWIWDNIVSNVLGAYYGRNFVKKLNPYAASSRAFNGYINSIRASVFEQGAQELMDDAKTYESHPEEFNKLADFVNTTTGRGSLGPLETNSRWLNTLFFAPRKVAAELKLFSPYAFIYYTKMPGSIRNKALLSLGKFVSMFMAANLLTMLGKKVLDPDDFEEDYKNFWNMHSSDFLTHHFGDKRLSVAGGAKSLLTFMARFKTGKFTDQYGVTTKLGERPNKDINTRKDLIIAYALGKGAPAIQLGAKIFDQKKGRELDKGELIEDVTVPMWIQDVDKLYKDAPLATSAILMGMSMLGANVRTVEQKEFKPSVTMYYTDKEGNPKKKFANEKETAIYDKTKSELATEKTQFHKQEGVWIDRYGEVTLSEERAEETIPFNKMTADQQKAFESSVNRSAGTAAKKQLGWNKKRSDEEE